MTIKELRILPPLAIGRLGSASTPLDNYTLEEDPDRPLGFRRIRSAETLIVDERTGEIREKMIPASMTFKEDGRIRPVAPFLEVFAVTDKDELTPLTLNLLNEAGLGAAKISWRVTVANRKVYRRTGNTQDIVWADTNSFSDYHAQRLEGHCKNFISKESFIDFGRVRFIKPNAAFPEIRLRFTPAHGLVYGPNVDPPDGIVPPERAIYDKNKDWAGFQIEDQGKYQNETLPPSLFAIQPPAPTWLYDNKAVSRGYLDDACDGIVEVTLALPSGKPLTASARITAGPPVTVPDSLFVRNLADDLEQMVHGPEVKDEPPELTRLRAEDIIRRAYETVRFMNVALLNGNAFQGRPPLSLDTMPEEESADTERAIRPVMSSGSVDTLAILALHEQVFAALRGGAAPWFLHLLRRPEDVADYTDHGRRKMPALMCGADNSYLALTHRQIDTIRKAAVHPPEDPITAGPAAAPPQPKLKPRNLSAQIHYSAAGNPISSRPITAISNCCPGLEVDFRGVWRRMFEGIVLREYDNLVVDIDPDVRNEKVKRLKRHRLLRVDGFSLTGQMRGPATSDVAGWVLLTTNINPYGLAPLEWSNALTHVLHKYKPGETVRCDFTKEESWDVQQPCIEDPRNYETFHLKLRPFFEGDTAVISKALAQPGELTQGLCSPWQNDYRECSCYYWASARPDYVNVEPSTTGLSTGDNWLQKVRTGQYVPDDYADTRLFFYDDLMAPLTDDTSRLGWEKWLRIQIEGRDQE